MDEGCERKRNMIGGLNSYRGSNGVKCEQIFHPPRHRECTRVGNFSVNQNAKFKCCPMCRRSGQPGMALRHVLLRVCARMQHRLKRAYACNSGGHHSVQRVGFFTQPNDTHAWQPTLERRKKTGTEKKRKYYMIYQRESPR